MSPNTWPRLRRLRPAPSLLRSPRRKSSTPWPSAVLAASVAVLPLSAAFCASLRLAHRNGTPAPLAAALVPEKLSTLRLPSCAPGTAMRASSSSRADHAGAAASLPLLPNGVAVSLPDQSAVS